MVEIVISAVGEVASKVAGCLLDPITRQLGYLFNYRRNITDLNQQIDSLLLERERLKIPVDEANRQGDEIFPGVGEWLMYAEGIIQNRDGFNEDEKNASKSCFYLKSRYQLSKKAKKQAAEIVVKIQQADTFHGRVSYRPPPSPPPFISSASFKDYEAFESRESTFNQIMGALKNKDMRVIGVWGMGGVGKTTLVKQVAQQAKEDKLFHKVVMALHISQTPNIAEIQEEIARILGLKFEAGEDRAGRLRKRLKKEEKILVILDDIWGRLELGEIGIPYGDDHKGCKVLLTSRERPVLSEDMRTQKEFCLQHLNEGEAWNLFKKTAGDSVEKLELQPIAVNVVKKCEGLPVAIVTIANALKNESVHVWENALEELRRSEPTNIRGVSENVYSCLELSYNHLKGNEVKSLFLLCGLLGDGDISMDRLLQCAMCLNLFERIYSWEKAINRLITLVKNLKASSLLLDHEDEYKDRYLSLFFDHTFVRMHDVVRDVARSIASKDPHRFVAREAVGSQEVVELREWQRTDECRNCTRISLICRNMDELAQGLVCPQLEFLLLNSSDDGPGLKIPDAFFQDTKQLRVLDLSGVSLVPSPSSLSFLSNLRTLRLNHCWILDIAVIGELKRLQVLSLAESYFEQLPKEMMQLSDLRVLDLRNCYFLKVIPRNVISSQSQLEYLSMEGSFDGWEKEGFNGGERINNACLSELKHLSGLRSLEVRVGDPSLLPEDDVLFDNLNLTRYSIVIGHHSMPNDEYKASGRLMLDGVKSLHMVNCFSKLLKTSQVLYLMRLNDLQSKDVVYELDKDGFLQLKCLCIWACPTIQYILHSTSAEWVPPCNTFCMLEELDLHWLSNLEAVCHCPTLMGSFRNLRILRLRFCGRLKYVFSLPTQHGRESAFPGLQSLELKDLSELISFYATSSRGSQESVTFFNQQAAFLSLEFLHVQKLDNVRTLWHNQLLEDSFSKLKELHVISCERLLNVFPVSLAKALVQLEDLQIDSCGVEAIVANENENENENDDEDDATPLFLFPRLTSLILKSLHQLKRFCLGRFTSRWPLLKKLEVCNYDKVEILFQEIGLEGELYEKIQQPLFLVEKVAFPSLEFFKVEGLDNVKALWHNQLPTYSISKLKELKISSCNKLLNIFPSNILKGLQSLQILEIHDYDALQEIFDLEGINGKELDDTTTTQSRNSLFNKDLQGLLIFQNLQSLKVKKCPCLKYLFTVFVAKALVQLEDLQIDSCGVEAIVSNEDEDEVAHLVLFPRLTSLILKSLHQLKRFCFKRFTSRWPLLKILEVCNCDKVEILFQEIGLEGELNEKIQQPLFLVEKEAFLNLEELRLALKGTVEIWRGQFSWVSFSKLRVLKIINCHGISVAISANMVQILHNLERLEVTSCDSVNEVIRVERLPSEEFHVETFPRLIEMHLEDLSMLMHLCGLGPYFQCFQTLEIVSCRSLINLVTPSMAKRLVQLKTLIIRNCHMVKEIVGDEPTDDKIDFTNLKELQLHYLPNLKSFCSARYTFQFPSLEEMRVIKCPKMEFFCKGDLDTPRLQCVQMSYLNFEEHWEGDLNTTIHKKFMTQSGMNGNTQDYKEEYVEELDSIDLDPKEEDFEEV